MSSEPKSRRLDAISAAVASALITHRQLQPFSEGPDEFSLADAYGVSNRLRTVFERRGERIVGRKIGFTNRLMWTAHGVEAPIWGHCTDRTTFDLATTPLQRAGDYAEPGIEPEIMFGLSAALSPDMDEEALLDRIEWVSLGYEIVQSIYPGWRFAAADTVAANALHGALLVGVRHPVAPRRSAWRAELADFQVELFCDGRRVQTGGGDLVLGSPLLALRHFVRVLAEDRDGPPLQPGEIVSTGTLTLAMPLATGRRWTTRASGIPLEAITLEIRP